MFARWTRMRGAAIAAAAWIVVAATLVPGAGTASAKEPEAACEAGAAISVFTSPMAPWRGVPLRVVLISEKPLEGELSLVTPTGAVAVKSRERHGGPPYFWFAEVASPVPGTWQASLARDGGGDCAAITRPVTVGKAPQGGPRQVKGSVWPLRASWSRDMENVYSAWIEKLFDAPLDAAPSWKALHDVLRDKSRNFLHNHLGLREDEQGLFIKPDCADLPYFLRAYFAFKMGLPFGYAKCTRGGGGHAPTCPQWWNIMHEEPPPLPPEQEAAGGGGVTGGGGGFFGGLFGGPPQQKPPQPKQAGKLAPKTAPKPPPKPEGLVPLFGYYLRNTLADGVHSGSGRTALGDDQTDYYPVALKEEALRPGTIYADPYGHILVLVRRVAQSKDGAGVFLAVDGQPDGTVARKRFWRGNFLFAQDAALGGPGFKRFRPVVRDNGGGLRRLLNAEIAKDLNYGDVSLEQGKLGVEAFYDRMDDVMSPAPLDPYRAIAEVIAALEEQVKARVTSVENGRKYQVGGGAEVAMPDGASIFETTGAWEDFATPSRDLRLLIAIDVVRGFPERVARRPERYAMPTGKSAEEVKAELEQILARELGERKVAYTRTDGSPWTLTVKDVVERAALLEMAYNINDCAELRWGAPEGSTEAATCKRRASPEQRRKMSEYRTWFHERRRPARGT